MKIFFTFCIGLFLCLNLTGQADLIVTDQEIIPESVKKRDLLQLRLTVTNQGNKKAAKSVLGINVTVNKTPGFIDLFTTEGYFIKELLPGESTVVELIYPIKSTAIEDSYYVQAYPDILETVAESDEQNLFTFPTFLIIKDRPTEDYTILPYPIILIHGWEGNDTSWVDVKKFYEDALGLRFGGELYYCLNQSETKTDWQSDVQGYIDENLSFGDFYIINFDMGRNGVANASDNNSLINNVYSNQAAIVKQGKALNKGIKKVLDLNKADKVILIGHSMGGLAAREYLQNESNWQSDGKHHVAKLLTNGTPNGGANVFDFVTANLDLFDIFYGVDVDYNLESEAVRDLRYKEDNENEGVYLNGGNEYEISSSFNNRDVNCDGDENDFIIGLNQKFAPYDLEYASIVGTGTDSHWGIGVADGDGIVRKDKAILKNFLKFNNPPFIPFVETFFVEENTLGWFHTEMNEERFLPFIMAGQDETEYFHSAQDIQLSNFYQGNITKQAEDAYFKEDIDSYHFYVPEKGKTTIYVQNIPVPHFGIQLYNADEELIGEKFVDWHTSIAAPFQLEPGHYYLDINADHFSENWKYPYYLAITHKPESSQACNVPKITGVQLTPDHCGDGRGKINLTLEGGNEGLSFLWSTGGTTASISQLKKGDYIVTISNTGGCKTTDTISLKGNDPLKINAVVEPITCYNANNGKINVEIAGGTKPYTINLTQGGQTIQKLDSLKHGTYGIFVKDAIGCNFSTSRTLTNPYELKASVDFRTVNGKKEAFVNITGGVSPYKIEWSNGQTGVSNSVIAAGLNHVIVKDKMGCMVKVEFTFSTTAIEQILANDIQLFPNPSNQIIHVEFGLTSQTMVYFKIINANGQEIINWQKEGINFNEVIDIKNFAAGNYWLLIEAEEGSEWRKFIKVD